MATPDLSRYVAVGVRHMKKLIDRMERLALTNAFAVLENHGMVKVHFDTVQPENGKEQDRWIISAFGTGLVTITQLEKNSFEMDIRE